jgi:hypothetical protein
MNEHKNFPAVPCFVCPVLYEKSNHLGVKHCHDTSSFKYTGELLLLSIPPTGDILTRSLRFILVFLPV